MKNTITLLLFVLLTQWVGAQSTNTLDKEDFSIVYPTTYQLDESKSMGTTFILYSAADTKKKEDFRENINLIMQEVNPAEMDLQAIIQSTGGSARPLMRSKEAIYAELGLDNPNLTEDALMDAMLAHPVLMNRPIVITAKGTRLCRPPELVLEILPPT